ncbi:MAG: folylpolyglutamate synthase/dihydrofolate synthase family protein [Bacillota bacterium]|nr:folylpolyglutamate synthase/dihydrofolate synthase family protein [Bacillota bacterium]
MIAQVQALTGTHFALGLGRVRRLLARLGDPHQGRRFIHVGGTNGKGSVTAMLENILRTAGYRVGAFISPHLQSYTERYRIDGRPVAPEELAALLEGLLPHLDALAAECAAPTEFEAHTAAALSLFAAYALDLAILEVGLGGRLDATNVILPEVAVITNVSIDHVAYLGRTVREIAAEKAGIIKDGVPLVTAAAGESLEVIAAACEAHHAPLILVGRDVTWEAGGAVQNGGAGLRVRPGQTVTLYGRLQTYRDLYIPLRGPHQQANAACAVAAAEVLAERGWDRITPDAVRTGLAETRWPGRFEVFPGRPAVILDGAHNAAGAAALAETLRLHNPVGCFVFVLGILDDKERATMVRLLAPLAVAVVVTRPPGPRAEGWRELASILRQTGVVRVEVEEEPRTALDRARGLAGPDGTVVVAGSLYLVGALRSRLR